MFRRLAESFQNESTGIHQEYVKDQDKYFNTLPNMILSNTSGLKGFDRAIKSVNTIGTAYNSPVVKYPNDIFIKSTSDTLNNLASTCSSSSIDQLIAIKNPNASIGCGWLYTPPNNNSPYPILSQGFIGDSNEPLQSMNPPEYKKWFFDLQLAKKQILIDKCKALKACSDTDSEAFKGVCGYCTDKNQGVPVDSNGNLLYSGDMIGSCNSQSIITDTSNCPKPSAAQGPRPIIDRTCEPSNGRLSSACLYNQVINGGCSDNGSLALALSGSPSPNDYISNLRNSDSVKIYNRVANPPLNLDTFSKGSSTVSEVLKEVRQLSQNTKGDINTALGASARDLCLQKGNISNYDFCNDLPDTSMPPFNIDCLQKIFKKMGGQPKGAIYPSTSNISKYNNMENLGSIKSYYNTIIQNMKNSDYNTQRNAMIQFLGISPESLIDRAPYKQGVEVFWFVPIAGYPNKVMGFLRRTIETNFIEFGGTVSSSTDIIPQIGIQQYSAMVQLTDIRASNDFSTKFRILVDDGFWIAVNQPSNIDKTAFTNIYSDEVGLFGNLSIQGPTVYESSFCSNYYANKPNITKIFYTDAGGDGHTFNMDSEICSGSSNIQPQNYSLTCEINAPFLNFEVDKIDSLFQEKRMPGLFSQIVGLHNIEYHVRTEETMNVPGNKAFARLNSANSSINMPNIAFQSWKAITIAFRAVTMPVKETILNIATGPYYYNLIAIPKNGNTIDISIEHNLGGTNGSSKNISELQIGTWYLITVLNQGNQFSLNIFSISSLINSKGTLISKVITISTRGDPLFQQNATWNPAPGQPESTCNIMIGTRYAGYAFSPSRYSTSSFNYDIAWVHFFQQNPTSDDIYRDCIANWIFTQFPESLNTYKTLE